MGIYHIPFFSVLCELQRIKNRKTGQATKLQLSLVRQKLPLTDFWNYKLRESYSLSARKPRIFSVFSHLIERGCHNLHDFRNLLFRKKKIN